MLAVGLDLWTRTRAGGGALPAVGGGALLTGETNGFATDFLHPVDAERVAVKTAGTVVPSGLSFFANAGTSSKWVFNSAGTLVNVPVGSLAVDYHPSTHAALGLLTEAQATNLLLNNATLSTQGVTVTAAAHTLSFLGTGTITLTGASTAGPLVGTGASNRGILTFAPSAGTLTCTVTGTVSNAQLETGSVATSIIPTLGATVTRAADNINFTSASINHSATAGSWWMDIGLTIVLVGGGTRILAYSGGGVPIYSFNTLAFALYDGASNISKTVTSVLGANKVAMAFASADRAITANGLAPTTDALAGIAFGTPGATIYLGRDASASYIATGYIRKIRYLPRRPTNAELQTMTT